MLFKLDKNFKAVLHPDAYRLCPGLRKLNAEQILYIILTYSYDSPYKLLPQEERKRTARAQVYGTVEYDPEERDKVVKKAIPVFMSLQYDPRRETIDTCHSKIRILERNLIDAKGHQEIANITKSIKHLNETAKDLQQEIDKDESLEELEGGGKLSLLEKMQASRKLYKLQHSEPAKMSIQEKE